MLQCSCAYCCSSMTIHCGWLIEVDTWLCCRVRHSYDEHLSGGERQLSEHCTCALWQHDLFDHDTSTSKTHFVNFAAFRYGITVSMTLNLAYRSSKVVDFGSNRKRAYYFLLVLNSNLSPILPRFRDIRAFVRRKPLLRYPSTIPAKISGCSPWSRSIWCCGLCRERRS